MDDDSDDIPIDDGSAVDDDTDEEALPSEVADEDITIDTEIPDLVQHFTKINEILDDDSDDIPADACTVDGVFYNNFDSVPNDDPCKLCFCQDQIVLCADRDCATPAGYEECTPLPTSKDKCCPDQFECSKSN